MHCLGIKYRESQDEAWKIPPVASPGFGANLPASLAKVPVQTWPFTSWNTPWPTALPLLNGPSKELPLANTYTPSPSYCPLSNMPLGGRECGSDVQVADETERVKVKAAQYGRPFVLYAKH